jgi:hypothetical protein
MPHWDAAQVRNYAKELLVTPAGSAVLDAEWLSFALVGEAVA